MGSPLVLRGGMTNVQSATPAKSGSASVCHVVTVPYSWFRNSDLCVPASVSRQGKSDFNTNDNGELVSGGNLEAVAMELPSSREIELETLLRQRDAQLAKLTVSNLILSRTCDVVKVEVNE